jgi:hypothetical protein
MLAYMHLKRREKVILAVERPTRWLLKVYLQQQARHVDGMHLHPFTQSGLTVIITHVSMDGYERGGFCMPHHDTVCG